MTDERLKTIRDIMARPDVETWDDVIERLKLDGFTVEDTNAVIDSFCGAKPVSILPFE